MVMAESMSTGRIVWFWLVAGSLYWICKLLTGTLLNWALHGLLKSQNLSSSNKVSSTSINPPNFQTNGDEILKYISVCAWFSFISTQGCSLKLAHSLFLYTLGPAAQWWYHPHLGGLSHIYHYSESDPPHSSCVYLMKAFYLLLFPFPSWSGLASNWQKTKQYTHLLQELIQLKYLNIFFYCR